MEEMQPPYSGLITIEQDNKSAILLSQGEGNS